MGTSNTGKLQWECYQATEHPCPQLWLGSLALWINLTVAGHDACLGEWLVLSSLSNDANFHGSCWMGTTCLSEHPWAKTLWPLCPARCLAPEPFPLARHWGW